MKLIVVHNPEAGGGDLSAEHVEQLLRAAGHAVQITSAKKKWRERLADDADAFVAAGGDGTVHDLVHALAGRDVAVAILPIGTANNVAHALGYRAGDDLALRVGGWQKNEKVVQIPVVEAGGERHPFMETVGVGAFVKMVRKGDKNTKKSAAALGLLAIRKRLVKKLLASKPAAISMQIDGRSVDGEYVLLECLNLPYYGPRMHLAPNQSPTEASVTVCGVPAQACEQAAQWIATGHGDPAAWFIGRGSSVELRTDEHTHVDGGIWPNEKAHTGHVHIHTGVRTARLWV